MMKTWPGLQLMHHAFDDQLELAVNQTDNLLVRVIMFREGRTGVDVYPRVRHAVAVNEAGPQARKDFAHR